MRSVNCHVESAGVQPLARLGVFVESRLPLPTRLQDRGHLANARTWQGWIGYVIGCASAAAPPFPPVRILMGHQVSHCGRRGATIGHRDKDVRAILAAYHHTE